MRRRRSVLMHRILKSIGELLQASVPKGSEIATTPISFSEVERVWTATNGMPRIVFQMP